MRCGMMVPSHTKCLGIGYHRIDSNECHLLSDDYRIIIVFHQVNSDEVDPAIMPTNLIEIQNFWPTYYQPIDTMIIGELSIVFHSLVFVWINFID